jgi:hypothetical protein
MHNLTSDLLATAAVFGTTPLVEHYHANVA